MSAEPLILAFDTSGPRCATALMQGDRVLATRFEERAKGQAERLMPLIEATLAEAGLAPGALDAIAVGVGPGNFTGIRISVSAARGLALALGIPAIGVTSFEAMRGPSSHRDPAPQLVTLEGPRGGLYVQHFLNGQANRPAHYLPDLRAPDLAALGLTADTPILGPHADILSALFPPADTANGPPWKRSDLPRHDLAAILARIAADKLAAGVPLPRPAPHYVKPADAAPSRDSGPVLL